MKAAFPMFSVPSLARPFLPFLMLLSAAAHADPVQSLKDFFNTTQSMRAQFHQTVLDAKGRKLQEVNGVMQLQRPGKFRWDYHEPYLQIIVGDGKKVWLHDPELNQVTVRRLDQVLGSSPAALLAGTAEFDKTFEVKNDTRQDDLDWVEVTPKSTDSGFKNMLLGFKEGQLAEMQLHDNFGQTTVIEFSKLERNPKLAPAQFKFVPPAGADVVGD